MNIGCLTIKKGLEEGKRYLLRDLTVFEGGRSQGHHVVLKDESVARSHFRIYRSGEEYSIYDLGTSKGTLVNGKPVEKVVLGKGDLLKVGDVELEFDLVDDDTASGRPASSAPEKQPALIIIDGRDKGQTYMLAGKERFKIGRGLGSDLKLNDGKISRDHCVLEAVRDHHVIVDLESSNGTVVNGERVKKTVLKEGDYIRLGFTLMRYEKV
jgi:pSer/pThr/pTyr-binding forkhead associated (FHA) protein